MRVCWNPNPSCDAGGFIEFLNVEDQQLPNVRRGLKTGLETVFLRAEIQCCGIMTRIHRRLHSNICRFTGVVQTVCSRIKQKVFYCGFTFVELLVLVVIVGTLATIAIPAGLSHIEKARIVRAIGEIRGLEKDIMVYEGNHETLPDTLNDVGRGTLKDPWGNSYEYLKIAGASVPEGGNRGGGSIMDEVRKDRLLVPVNSDYDLYSKGKDGESRPPFNSSKGRDDIVRANDGGYVGLASEF